MTKLRIVETEIALYDAAVTNGCEPEWRDGVVGWAWHCSCDDQLHAHDQQCSVITPKSALRRRSA